MTAKRFSRLFCQLMGLVMFASLSIWSSSTFAACNDTVPNGLVACYPFNGNANDASGKGNNGTLKGGVALTTDRFGNPNSAYQLDGISGYIEAADSPNLDVGTGDYSMSIWLHYQGNGSVDKWNVKGALVDKREGIASSATGGYSLYLSPNQVATQMVGGGQYNNFTANAVIENNGSGKWRHIVATVERSSGSTRVKLYMDGKIIQTLLFTAFASLDNKATLKIGYTNGQIFLKASVDDVRLYKRALTDIEVKQLYDESAICTPATYTNGLLQVPSIAIDGVIDAYQATMQQLLGSFAFQVTQSAVVTSKSCPATYSSTTGILNIPLVKTKAAIPLNTSQCYNVTMQAFSDRFQLDLDKLKVVKCP